MAIINIVLLVPTTIFANNASTEVVGNGETNAVFTSSKIHCLANVITSTEIEFLDNINRPISQGKAGAQISVQIINTQAGCHHEHHSITVLLEVKDSDDVTKHLAYQQFVPEPNQPLFYLTFTWTPDKPGEYTARVFPINCLNCLEQQRFTTRNISVY